VRLIGCSGCSSTWHGLCEGSSNTCSSPLTRSLLHSLKQFHSPGNYSTTARFSCSNRYPRMSTESTTGNMLSSHNGCPKCGAKIAAVNEPHLGQDRPYRTDKVVGRQNLQFLRRGKFVSCFLWLVLSLSKTVCWRRGELRSLIAYVQSDQIVL
jgi:ribosomal protein L32